MRLCAELQSESDADLPRIFLLHRAHCFVVARIVRIRERHLGRLSYTALANGHLSGFIPVLLDPVVHMLRKAQLVNPPCNRVPHDSLHRIGRVVAERRVHMIVCAHRSPPFHSFHTVKIRDKPRASSIIISTRTNAAVDSSTPIGYNTGKEAVA